MKKIFLLFIFVIPFFAQAQLQGPEQDCAGAIHVCQLVYVQPNSYTASGQVQDFPTVNSCMVNGENNSVWYTFEAATSGIIEFLITPDDPQDYDFAVYNITNQSCADIATGNLLPVRCNYSSISMNATGLQSGATDTTASSSGPQFLKPLSVVAGQQYVLVVDKFNSDPIGYTLDFSASTAVLANPSLAMQSAFNVNCNNDSAIIVTFSAPVQCSSVLADGTNFLVTGPSGITITTASAVSCSGSSSSRIRLGYTGTLQEGAIYAVTLKAGSNGSPLSAFCGAVSSPPLTFIVDNSLADKAVADFSYFTVDTAAYFIQQSTYATDYHWDFGDGTTASGAGIRHDYATGGVYQVCLVAEGFCLPDTICKQVGINTNRISGKVYLDSNEDCQFGMGDLPLVNKIIRTQPGFSYTMTDSLGNYSVRTGPGNIGVHQVITNADRWVLNQLCPANFAGHQISFSAPYQDTSQIDFADSAMNCPFMTVDVSAGNRRMCAASTTKITYCNLGAGVATDVRIEVVYPEHLTLSGASMIYTDSIAKLYVFNIGTLQPQQCGSIHLNDFVTCDQNAFGLTQCVEVRALAANLCNPVNPNWSGADIQVEGVCNVDETTTLEIVNAGAGNMVDSSIFRIYLDSLLVLTRKFKLKSLDTLEISFSQGTAQTIRLEADQVPYHPRNTQVSVAIEGCTLFTPLIHTGFVNQFPPSAPGPEFDITCGELRNSFDPNDKQAVPTGVTQNHYIKAGTKTDYTIRFQNTGNDTAYNVMITDTLSYHLDLSTFQAGPASHPYRITMTGAGVPVLVFSFNNIYLPDSLTDPAGSQGFVSFSIASDSATAELTRVENAADIYFDLNAPVRTNRVFHTISATDLAAAQEPGGVVITYRPGPVGIQQVLKEADFTVFPNPSSGRIMIQLNHSKGYTALAEVFDVCGKSVHTELVKTQSGRADLNLHDLAKGVYILKLSNSDFIATRKFTLLR